MHRKVAQNLTIHCHKLFWHNTSNWMLAMWLYSLQLSLTNTKNYDQEKHIITGRIKRELCLSTKAASQHIIYSINNSHLSQLFCNLHVLLLAQPLASIYTVFRDHSSKIHHVKGRRKDFEEQCEGKWKSNKSRCNPGDLRFLDTDPLCLPLSFSVL